jgi:hypothetical protein
MLVFSSIKVAEGAVIRVGLFIGGINMYGLNTWVEV